MTHKCPHIPSMTHPFTHTAPCMTHSCTHTSSVTYVHTIHDIYDTSHTHTDTINNTHTNTHHQWHPSAHAHNTHMCTRVCVCVCMCVSVWDCVGLQVCVNVLLKKEHHDCSHIVQFKIIQSESNGGIHVLKVVCILWYGFVLCPCIHWDLLCTFSVWTNNVMFLNKVFCMSCMHASAQIGMPERVWVLWRQTQEQCDHLGQPLCWQPLDVECSCHRLLHPLLDFPSRLWHLLFNLPADIWDLLQQAEKLPHCTLLQCWNERTIALDDAPNEPKPGSCQDTKINSYKCKEQHFHPST